MYWLFEAVRKSLNSNIKMFIIIVIMMNIAIDFEVNLQNTCFPILTNIYICFHFIPYISYVPGSVLIALYFLSYFVSSLKSTRHTMPMLWKFVVHFFCFFFNEIPKFEFLTSFFFFFSNYKCTSTSVCVCVCGGGGGGGGTSKSIIIRHF